MRSAAYLITVMLWAMIIAGTVFAATSLSSERRDELSNLVIQDCGSCHGLTMKGGLGPSLLPSEIEDREAADLVEIILNGVPGTPMPPWSPELNEGEAYWIVEFLKRGTVQ